MLNLRTSLRRRRAASLLAVILWVFGVHPVGAQFLRLGPLNLGAQAELEGIYTTNVEGQRPSEAEKEGKEMEDYYLLASFDLRGDAPFGRNTTLRMDSGMAIEKHAVRDDLDNQSNPFGRVRLDTHTEAGRYVLDLYAGVKREIPTEELTDDVYVPGGRKKRDVTDTIEYGGSLGWSWRAIRLQGSYDFTSERHQDEEFKDGDKDDTSMAFDARWQIRKDLAANYSYERSRTELVNDPEDDPRWETTETISLDWTLPLWERPKITYSLGVERETQDGEQGDWELTHSLTLQGTWDLSPTVNVTVDATYQYEDNPEEDDISFTYGATIKQELSATASHQLSVSREPVETFGSTTETDSTGVDYQFRKRDLFIYDLNLTFSVSWERNEPMAGDAPVEKTWDYSVMLNHVRQLTLKLARELRYQYTLERSNLEEEDVEEHRVTLTLTYTF